MATTILPQNGTESPKTSIAAQFAHTRGGGNLPRLLAGAGARQREQLPSFSPLLDEIELAGYTDPNPGLSASFHDWFPLDDGRILVTVGQTAGPASRDPLEAALVTQMVWTASRCYARQAADAGQLLSLVAHTVGISSAGETAASLAVALVDPLGTVNYAAAGNCLVGRIRAASCELLPTSPIFAGLQPDAAYMDYSLELRPRERLVFLSDPLTGDAQLAEHAIANHFATIPAESHRAMSAKETLKQVRAIPSSTATSMAVIRRR